MVGAPGTVVGVTELDAADWAPVPTAVDGRHLEGVGGALVRPVTVSVVAVR